MNIRWFILLLALTPLAAGAMFQGQDITGYPNAGYATGTSTDAIARLQQKLDRGELNLGFDSAQGYLSSLLATLDIPVSSQSLVFSKSSFQLDLIGPQTPRAIYFNDDVYVGFVQGGPLLEFAAVDPKLGAVFYTLAQDEAKPPHFEREFNNCMQCHVSSRSTKGIPGLLVRSLLTDPDGYSITEIDKDITTDQSPFQERFGGWYVTGTHGDQTHWGNVNSRLRKPDIGNLQTYMARMNLVPTSNVTDLTSRFDTHPYLSSHSDIVAHLLLIHQANVHNLITRAGYEARAALHDDPQLSQSATRLRIESAAEPLVRALLFRGEAPLPGPIAGTSTFATDFMNRGRRDDEGRSLRDLDLTHRLFRYPLSYLIYSEAFDALPDASKDYVDRRLRQELITPDGKAALEILDRTTGKPGD